MGATLQAVIELQEIELQIVDIRRQLARKERMVTGQLAKLEQARNTVEAERQEQKKAQMEVDALDLDLKSRTASINKLRDQLNSVKTNKEYAAILVQLNNEKADASRVEAKALELMGKADTRKKALTDHEQSGSGEAARLTDLKAQLEQSRQLFADRLAALEQKRTAAAAKLDAGVLTLFNRVSERYDGEAMAKVLRTNPRRDEFICEGCNMSLSTERANGLLTRDDVQTCNNCGRILYIDKGT